VVKSLLLFIYFLLRAPFLWLIRFALPARRKEKKEISRILIIRLDRIGDFVTSLPVIKNIAAAFPGAKVDVLVQPFLADLARLDSHIDNVIVYDGFFQTASRLRAQGYDIAVDMLLDHKIKTALLAYATGAGIRSGFAWGFREVFFTHAVSLSMIKGKKMVDAHLELLKAIYVPGRFTVPVIDVPRRRTEGALIVSVHPGGYYPSQRWGADNFSAVIMRIIEKHKACVKIIASPSEKGLADQIVSRVNSESAEAVFPRTSSDLVSVLAQSDIVVCNNSGPLHIAAALGIPTVSTMGPTDPVLWQPTGEKNIVICKGLDCSPCSKSYCSHHSCLAMITPEEVFQAVESAINRFIKDKV
jgi:ADP-heptose:LPS heptosyltransferase